MATSRRWGLILGVMLGAACIDTSGPKDSVCIDASFDDLPLDVTVGPGLKPRISWTPECMAFSLVVVDTTVADDDNVWWGILSRDTVFSLVPPSLVYGTPPPNTLQGLRARPLQVGRVYRVFVVHKSGSVIGDAHFTP